MTVVAHDHGGSGIPIVFCHATGFHGRYWDPVCRRLSSRFRCITVDLRGHGDSTIPEGLELLWDGMAQDLLVVIEAFGLDSVHAVGHSMGGCTILKAEMLRPGTVERAWLFDPIVYPRSPSGRAPSASRLLARRARRRQEVFASRDAAFERYQTTPPFEAAAAESLRAYVEFGFADRPDGSVVLKCRGEIEALVYELCPTDVVDRLHLVKSITTVAGSGDAVPPARLAPLIAERLPCAHYEHHPDLSHLGPMEAPTRVAAAIAAALG